MKDSIRTWLASQFGDDEALFEELYGQYSADMKKTAQELDGLLSSGDIAAIGEKGHAMKGMALQMGDTEVGNLAKSLQDAGRGGDASACANIIPTLVTAISAL